jgi:sigma-B regulation protein RsbU (phosphoserine phosphatase)
MLCVKASDSVSEMHVAPEEFPEQPSVADLRAIEIGEARRIQNSLLPAGPLHGANFEIACRFAPFSDVSGDFADYFQLPNGIVGLYVGDVVGKGLPAAMYGTMVMGTLRGTNKSGEDTGAILATLNNRLLVRPVSGRFCSTVYALFNPATLELQFSNAGMPYPLHVSAAGCKAVGQGGIPSGLFSNSAYEVHTIQLRPGDGVLFATDGLQELRNSSGEDFSGPLPEVLRTCSGRSAEETLDRLLLSAREFAGNTRQHDDLTVVLVKALRTMVLRRPGGGFSRIAGQ